MVNGCFILENIGQLNIKLYQGKKELRKGDDFRTGIVRSVDGDKLVLWINKEANTTQNYIIEF